MTFRRLVVGCANAAVLAAFVSGHTGCSRATDAEPPSAKTHVVNIRGMAFEPKSLRIAPGDAVQWVNRDIVPHAVKAAGTGEVWQSKDLPPGESWTKTVSASGAYLCPYHPTMTGEIAVAPP